MYWLILGVLCALFAVAALILWQKWAAPWSQIEQLVSQVARGEAPSTFLVNGGAGPHRIGLALENIFAHQQELERQIAGRESGTQTILGAMQDGLLVVDARNRIMLMNQPFEKLFELRDPAVGVPLIEAVRHATLEVLLDEPETQREELARILSIMERHSKRLQRLVDDLLSLAQLESSQATLELSDVLVDELFNNLIRDWKEKLAAKNLKVCVDSTPE